MAEKLQKEIWTSQIMDNFYPNDNFLTPVRDYSQFVDNDSIHIPSVGIDPVVLINNTTYPINTIIRTDEDNEIILDKFETENTIIRRPDALEYSYDKLESVIFQHRATLKKAVSTKAIHAFAPQKDTTNTPVILTSGQVTNGRKRLSIVDILAMKERFDAAEIPLEDRYIVLHPKHVTDLLLEDVNLFKNITDLQNGEPFKFGGFGFYSFSSMPTYTTLDGILQKIAFGEEQSTQFASVAFYAKEVMKADGAIYMYADENNPKERGTIVGFDKRFVALPIRGRGIGAIVSNVENSTEDDENVEENDL